jgi:hypothetical protein
LDATAGGKNLVLTRFLAPRVLRGREREFPGSPHPIREQNPLLFVRRSLELQLSIEAFA